MGRNGPSILRVRALFALCGLQTRLPWPRRHGAWLLDTPCIIKRESGSTQPSCPRTSGPDLEPAAALGEWGKTMQHTKGAHPTQDVSVYTTLRAHSAYFASLAESNPNPNLTTVSICAHRSVSPIESTKKCGRSGTHQNNPFRIKIMPIDTKGGPPSPPRGNPDAPIRP